MYFSMETVPVISKHIMALYAAKMTAFLKDSTQLDIHLEHEDEDDETDGSKKHGGGAVFIHTSRPGVSVVGGPQVEQRIDAKYLDGDKPYRLETYRSQGTVSSASSTQLRCYFVTRCNYPADIKDPRDIRQVGDVTFLSKATPHTLALYERVMQQAMDRTGPVIEMLDVEGSSRCKRLVIGYR